MPDNNPFKKIRVDGSDTKRSITWYQDRVKSLSKTEIQPRRLMQNTSLITNYIKPGHMYMFFYDAKMKEKLPYWDMFPLVLPYRSVPDGFYGINLHYLPYIQRFNLLGALHEYAADDKINEQTKIKVNWAILERMSRIAPMKACVKHYLHSHVQSRFLHIPYPDWKTASLLPVEKFVGADKQSVWRASREMH